MNDLKITVFDDEINKYIESAEKVSQTIDDQQAIINSNEELFIWLYSIKENSIDTIKNLIVNSIWIQTEENVQELIAFILQIVQADSSYQPYIIDLLMKLDKESDSINSLKILISFLIEKVTVLLGENLAICSFVYNMYKNKIILKEKLMLMIQKVIKSEMEVIKSHKNWSPYYLQQLLPKIYNLITWFYPEASEEIKIQMGININEVTPELISKYFPGNEEGYLKMRNSGEPDDEITKSLKYDDVGTFQKLVIKNGLCTQKNNNIANELIPFNIYDDFIFTGTRTYINYACSYGSIKCFKYLLLNHASIDSYTFKMAVFGGNTEIIRIVNQITKEKNFENDLSTKKIYNESIYPSIIKHQNDIFDWIFQEEYLNHEIDNDTMKELLLQAANNGNAHALIEFIDNGFNFINNAKNIFVEISKKGYYLLTKLFFVILQKVKEKNIYLDYSYSGYFGNISIFKISNDNINHEYELNDALQTIIKCKYTKIIQYFFQNLINDNFTSSTVFYCLKASISQKNNEMFNYLVQQFLSKKPSTFYNFYKFDQLLSVACSKTNIYLSKIIIDMIIRYNHQGENFSDSFIDALISGDIEMCKYFIDMKLFINYEYLSNKLSKLSNIKVESFDYLIRNADPETKEVFLNKNLLEKAIANKNKNLVEYLLKSNVISDNSLFMAVSQDDSDFVNLILKYNTSFINKISKDGPVLCMAIANNNLNIVKSLLSIQGINPSLYDKNHKTPLIYAVEKVNFEIANEILNFYGEDNQTESIQFNISLKILLKYLFNKDEKTKTFHYMHFLYEGNRLNEHDVINILKRILKFKAIDPNCFYKNSTLLIYACENNKIDILTILLQHEKTDVNLYSPQNGNSPLMISILKNNIDIAKMLIEHPRTNINFRNFNGEAPLTISVNNNLEVLVDLLINNERFDPEESCINEAFYCSSGNISNLLSSVKSLDVNYHSYKYNYMADNLKNKTIDETLICDTTLINSIEKNDIDKINLIINHHSFNQTKSQLIKAIFTAVEYGSFEIYKKLIKLINNKVNIYDSNNTFLFNFSVKHKNVEIVKDILANPNLDLKNCNILSAFSSYVKNNTDQSISMMNEILNFDRNHFKVIDFKKLLPTGESFFTLIGSQQFIDSQFISIVINSFYTAEIASFLLDHGVDPNISDKNGFYPLEYAIMLDSIDFVRVLINTNKIDFTQIVETKSNLIRICDHQLEGSLKPSSAKKKTYLHIAARSKKTEILKELVEKNVIDINATDELGETPLFEACRFNRLGNIEYLASLNNIDYNHCNNDGDDTLKMSTKLLGKFYENEITNRNDYFKALLSIFPNDDISFLDSDQLD